MSLRGAALALVGGITGTIAVTLTFVGCGDDNVAPADGGGDVTTDTTTDVVASDTTQDTRADVRGDVITGDANEGGRDVSPGDTGLGETGPHEAGPDAQDAGGPFMARADGGDAGDAGMVADADASDGDGGKVIPPGLLAYPQRYATAICAGFANCCGATFDQTACQTALATQGYDSTLPQNPNVIGAGNLTFDPVQATLCTMALQNWPCTATWTALQNQAILSACSNVLGGTIPIGGTGCLSSFECVTGAYCNGGTCTALAGDGGTCAQGESTDVQCRHIGTAAPGLYCNLYPDDGGGAARVGTCMPAQPDGVGICSDLAAFYSDFACANQLCDFGGTATCVATGTNPADPAMGFECSNFITDAGGGG